MKKISLGTIAAILFFFVLLPIDSLQASDHILDTDLLVEIYDDNTLDLTYTINFDTFDLSEHERTYSLSSSYEDVTLSSDGEEIPVIEFDEEGGQIEYSYDRRHSGSKSVTLYATNVLDDSQRGVYHFAEDFQSGADLLVGVEEHRDVTIVHPESMVFLSAFPYGLETVTKTSGMAELEYSEVDRDFVITFADKSIADEFIRIEEGGHVFYVQNHPELVRAVERSLNELDLIEDFPSEGELYILFNKKHDVAAYAPNRVIWVNKSTIRESADKLVSTMLHEFTHYAEPISTTPPLWLSEGLAVYTEIKYHDETYFIPDAVWSGGYWGDSKIELDTLHSWYEQDDYVDFDSPYFSDMDEEYEYYGFVINYFAKTYGEEELYSALDEYERREYLSLNDSRFEYDPNAIAEDIFVEIVGSKDEFYFPERALFESDRAQFDEDLEDFYVIPEDIEYSNETEDVVIPIVILVLIAIGAISVVLFKRSRK